MNPFDTFGSPGDERARDAPPEREERGYRRRTPTGKCYLCRLDTRLPADTDWSAGIFKSLAPRMLDLYRLSFCTDYSIR